MANIALLLSITMSLVLVDCYPSNAGQKVTFSDATSIDFEKIQFNEADPEQGSPEYYNSLRWISVNNEGMQHEGTLDEVMEIINSSPEEDSGDPISHGNAGENNDDSSDELSFKAVSQALDETIAEKRSIIGDDSRKLVSPPNRFPYTAMGRVDIGCSGTFIAPRTVLTSAHCVHEGKGGKWYKRLNFSRNKDCNKEGDRYSWVRAVTLSGWIEKGYMSYDIAVIIFRKSSNAIMQFDALTSTSVFTVNNAGYPGDKPGRCLWRTSCRLNRITPSLLYYPCDTFGGNSGSAIYKYIRRTNVRTIYGVHGYGGRSSNKAVRITQEYENCLRCWIVQYGGN